MRGWRAFDSSFAGNEHATYVVSSSSQNSREVLMGLMTRGPLLYRPMIVQLGDEDMDRKDYQRGGEPIVKYDDFVPPAKYKPVLMGMNSPSSGEALDLFPEGGAGHRLWKLSGYSLREYLDTFDRMNLLEDPVWSDAGARKGCAAVRSKLKGLQVVVLGQQAWSALALPKVNLFDPHFCVDKTKWMLMPHTSGKNLWYNEKDNRARAKSFLQAFG